MSASILKLHYRSLEKFRCDLKRFKTGRVLIPSRRQLPAGTRLQVDLEVAGCLSTASLEAEVIQAGGAPNPAATPPAGGILLGLTGDFQAALQPMALEIDLTPDGALRPSPPPAAAGTAGPTAPHNPQPVDLPEAPEKDAPLSMTWIMAAVAQEEVKPEPETPFLWTPEPAERKDLSPAERQRAQPAAVFVMDLTKAMLRTGYYSPEHPGSRQAKIGLFESLQSCLQDADEIMLTHRETRERSDILITGILEEPVNVRILVGPGMAELFVPKLREYFNRKGLVSFALKKSITQEHFEHFVDIMSDPRVDRSKTTAVGELLTRALVEQGITEISTVFLDDIIVLERNLPWRVEMAIQRLAKDLKVLPMFRSETDEGIKQMKLQIVQDILRPLRQPEFLKDLIVNCYVIVRHVTSISEEEIESAVIQSFPLNTLLPTSRFIFDEMHHLRELSGRDPGNDAIKRRFSGVRRILKRVTRRLVHEKVRGAQGFLDQLHSNGILAFHELPEDVQYLVNTRKMAKDVLSHLRSYIERILSCAEPGEAEALLKCFRRVILPYMDQGEWRVIRLLTRAVKTAVSARIIAPDTADLPTNPLLFLFADRQPELQEAYEKAPPGHRRLIEDVLEMVGEWGVEVLGRIISESQSFEARNAALEALSRRGAMARDWMESVLRSPAEKWSVKRSALLLLGRLASGPHDLDRARAHLNHYHPRVREEALNTLVALKAADAEREALMALDDPDEKLRWRATHCLAELAPLSRQGMERLLALLRQPPQGDRESAGRQRRKLLQLLRAVANMRAFEDPAAVEGAVLEVARKASARKAGLITRIRSSRELEESDLFSVAVATLGSIGGERSEKFIAKKVRGKSREAAAADKALRTLRSRGAS
jgi:hypothetical protein